MHLPWLALALLAVVLVRRGVRPRSSQRPARDERRSDARGAGGLVTTMREDGAEKRAAGSSEARRGRAAAAPSAAQPCVAWRVALGARGQHAAPSRLRTHRHRVPLTASPLRAGRPRLPHPFPARRRQPSRCSAPSGGTSPAGFTDGAAANRPSQSIGFQITFFRARPDVDERNPSAFTPRQLIIAHAALSDAGRGRLAARPAASHAPRSAWRVRMKDARASGSTTGRSQQEDARIALRIPAREFTLSTRIHADAAAAPAGRRRLQPQRPAPRIGELLLQHSASAGARHARRNRQAHVRVRQRVARPRMVFELHGRARRRAGTGSASISTTAAR